MKNIVTFWRKYKGKIVTYAIITLYLLSFPSTVGAFGNSVPEKNVADAIEDAQTHLLQQQKENKYWAGEIYFSTWETSTYILFTHYIDAVDEGKEAGIVRWLIDQQNPDGSWGVILGGPGDISATCAAYLALNITEVPVNHSVLLKAKEFIEAPGGIQNADPYTQVFYALHGEFSWDGIVYPIPPIEMMLIPESSNNSIYAQFSAWSRCSNVPLSVVTTLKKYGGDTTPSQNISLQIAEAWLLEHQNIDGSWYNTYLPTVLSILALYELGYDTSNPKISSALNFLNSLQSDDGYYIYQHRYTLPVWDTALAIAALRESGLNPSDPRLCDASRWLMNAQSLQLGDWFIRYQIPPGGWPFHPNNTLYPDVDDTALVISALISVNLQPWEELAKQNCTTQGYLWMVGMRNDDGGWAAFDHNQSIKDPCALPPIFLVPTVEQIDPSVADVTGHVLSAMGRYGCTIDTPNVKKAIEFLKKDQCESGVWWGRWGNCYIYATGAVLMGLNAVGEDMSEPYVLKAVHWLKSHQNSDGGWGEVWFAYFIPQYAGIGNSTATQTSWALMGLLAAGVDPESPSIQKGIDYLLAHQNEDGGWDPSYTSAALMPGEYAIYSDIFSLTALGMFKNTLILDTGHGTYPSIVETHTGNLIPRHNISASRMYTYPCSGTGGHSEYVRFYNDTWYTEANWTGYQGDWHNIIFNESFTLKSGEIYNYTIKTGSYPQIIHEPEFDATGGVIICNKFTDVNGKIYKDWIPAIRLE